MQNKKIYKCDLFSVNEEFYYNNKLSDKENIIFSKLDNLGQILVEKTYNKKYVKEIISGYLIPVYEIKTYYGIITCENGETLDYGVDKPFFVKIEKTSVCGIPCFNDLKEASLKEIENYKKHYLKNGSYDDYIYSLGVKFYQAICYFKQNNKFLDEKKYQKLLKIKKYK